MEIHSIAFIPDGNRRFATAHGIRLEKAYQLGTNKSWDVLQWLRDYPSIRFGTFYTLSLENLRRQKSELELLFHIFENALDKARNETLLMQEDIRLKFSGRLDLFPQRLRDKMNELETWTGENKKKTINLAMGYSGQSEIVDAAKRIAVDIQSMKLQPGELDEKRFHSYLYSDTPDPDLIIRTSGTQRLSGFLTYQSAYSELYFCPHFWPEFTRSDLDDAIGSYHQQQRNFGK